MNYVMVCIGLILALLNSPTAAREPIRLAVLTASPPSMIDAIVLKEVYRQAGIPLLLLPMPGLRSSAEADAGRIDGEVARVASYGEQHSNLIRVDPALDALAISAYFKSSLRGQIKNRSDLKHYRVGYVRGLKSPADMVKHLPKASDTQTSKSLVQMLAVDRFEVIVNNDSSTDFYIERMGLQNIDKVQLSYEPLHHYLHKKHHELVPLLGQIITRLAKSGELAQLIAQAEKEVRADMKNLPE